MRLVCCLVCLCARNLVGVLLDSYAVNDSGAALVACRFLLLALFFVCRSFVACIVQTVVPHLGHLAVA